MKRFFSLLLFSFLLSLGTGCKKDNNINYKPVPSPFSASPETPGKVAASGATINITIKAGTDGWILKIPSTSPWCTSGRIYGSGDFILPIKIAPNTTGQERSTEIILAPTFDQKPVAIIITQEK